jgi:hypothetical protein
LLDISRDEKQEAKAKNNPKTQRWGWAYLFTVTNDDDDNKQCTQSQMLILIGGCLRIRGTAHDMYVHMNSQQMDILLENCLHLNMLENILKQ